MRETGLQGVVRGRRFKTTQPETAARPADLVDRNFTATRPNQLWVADLTYVATWRGRVYVASVIDAFSRYCRVEGVGFPEDRHCPGRTQALWSPDTEGLIHHSDRGVQYLSIRYTERLQRPASSLLEAKETLTTTRWPNRSSG